MEFFEKAHVSRNKLQKSHKTEETVRKQLKQMLHGYKQNDNELIKGSAELKSDFDDTSSVSGFSDLNITNSSDEDNTTQGTVNFDCNDISLTDENDLSVNKKLNTAEEDSSTVNNLSSESTSEYQDEIASLSEGDAQLSEDSSVFVEDISLNSSFIDTSTDAESESSTLFDADGVLAAKIMEKISNKKKLTKKLKSSKKRKFSETDDVLYSLPETQEMKVKGPYRPIQTSDKETKSVGVELPEREIEYKGPYRPRKANELNEDSEASVDNASELSVTIDSPDSSPFVSVTATKMTSQSLDDIVGEYIHPTMKNLPSDFVISTQNTGMFDTEEMIVKVSQMDDEVNSLVPEVDNDLTIEDIDIDTTELDISTQLPSFSEESTPFDDTLQTISENEPSTESIDEAIVSPVNVYYGKNNCIIVLKHPAELYLHGKVKIQALGGTVETQGYILQEKTCEVYAPIYNYSQYVRTVEKDNTYYGLFSKLTAAGISVSYAEEIVTTLGEYDGVINLKQLRSNKIDFVENNFTVANLFRNTSKNVDNSLRKASELLGCSLYLMKPWKSFEVNPIWKSTVSCGMKNQSKGIVCGGKGAGKSTFMKYYVNRLLAQGPVLVIDLDPGQCEFTPAGSVAATVVMQPLLGPNFTHLRTPELMLNLGTINTMDNPRRYASAIETLITHCSHDEHLKNMPWIINTMGMTNALGLKFMTLIILKTQPTFVFQIDTKNSKKRFDYYFYPQTVKNLYFEDYQNDVLFKNVSEHNLNYAFFVSRCADNVSKSNLSLAPREERYLNYLAYFGTLLSDSCRELLDITPYEVNLKDLNIGSNVKIDKRAVGEVINGKVVSLCQRQAGEASSSGHVFTLDDRALVCHGHGLIRGIDWEKGTLFIVTPVPAARLGAVNTLVYADWTPELRGWERTLPPRTPVPYRTATAYQQRQLMFAPKRRFNPLQLLKLTKAS